MKKEVLIFGHRVPDTDSVASAITLSYLKQQQGINAIPRVLGDLNKESKFVLEYFGVKAPMYLNDVKPKVKHTSFQKDHILLDSTSILECYEYFDKTGIRTLPVVDKEGYLKGLISMKDIVDFLVKGNTNYLNADFDDIIKSINGKVIIGEEEGKVSGNLVVASHGINKLLEVNSLNSNSILIVGDRVEVIDYAIGLGVRLLVLTGNTKLTQKQLELVESKDIPVISSSYDTYMTSNKIVMANLIEDYITEDNVVSIGYNSYIEDFVNLTKNNKYKNYPVMDKDNKCLGLINKEHLLDIKKKEVILVDHNELSQSVEGIKEANIIQVVDHHNISSISTALPINFTTMPVGCTNTIIYGMYKDLGIEIPKEIAGLMLSAIVSDTLFLKSPTTTKKDVEVLNALVDYLGIDINKYVDEMFKAGTSLEGLSVEEIINIDIKELEVNSSKFTIGQVMTMDVEAVLNMKEDIISYLNKLSEDKNYVFAGLFITDIIKECSYVLYSDNSKEILKQAYNLSEVEQGVCLKNIVSRKKQVVPNLIYILDK